MVIIIHGATIEKGDGLWCRILSKRFLIHANVEKGPKFNVCMEKVVILGYNSSSELISSLT